MKDKIKYESPTEELERLRWENVKLQTELIENTERLSNHNLAIICPNCNKRVKSTDSRIKIVEFIRVPDKRSWDSGAWKSRTLNNFHPKCWKSKKVVDIMRVNFKIKVKRGRTSSRTITH